MRLSSFIARRIVFNQERSFSKFIINIAIAATALSVAVMILATALVNGFQQVISEKIFSFWGHIHITQFQSNDGPLTEEAPFPDNPAMVMRIRALPGIASVNAYATKSAILKTDSEIEGVIFKGVNKQYDWPRLQLFLQKGRLPHFPDSSYSQEILISDYLARQLQLRVNDPLIIYFIQSAGLLPRARRLTIAGIYKTSIEEYDRIYVIGDLRLVSRLNDWQANEIGGYEIFLKDFHQMDAIGQDLFQNYLPEKLNAKTIREIYPNIFDWLNLQNMNEVIILVIMTIVAVINMITAILILILERTNMVGILKALGMPNWQLQKIFILQAGYIILTGLLIGNTAGLGLCLLQQSTGFFKLPEESYYISAAPINVKWWEVLLINGSTLAICLLVLLLPSLLVKKILPVKAIQFK